jgi:4,5-DOPA dioxygenase extradiol
MILPGSMHRRHALRALAALPLVGCSRIEQKPMTTNQTSPKPADPAARMPVIFAAHGAPVLLDDEPWMAELATWAKAMPKPKSVLMISAHWEQRPTTLGATRSVPLVYDFYGFPERFYQMKYPAPGAPDLAGRVKGLLRGKDIATVDDPDRGLDHGAYVPLVAMYPSADVPVLQVSMPGLVPKQLFELGRALAPLRNEGVLIFGSGFLTHNMSYAFRRGTPAWAREFDDWAKGALERQDVDALLDFQTRAPAAQTALPTWEHYAPVLVAAGAASDAPGKVSFPITGFWMDGAFTRRSVQYG